MPGRMQQLAGRPGAQWLGRAEREADGGGRRHAAGCQARRRAPALVRYRGSARRGCLAGTAAGQSSAGVEMVCGSCSGSYPDGGAGRRRGQRSALRGSKPRGNLAARARAGRAPSEAREPGYVARRYAQHEQVAGPPHVRLFVSTPLVLSNGACVGTLCGPSLRPGSAFSDWLSCRRRRPESHLHPRWRFAQRRRCHARDVGGARRRRAVLPLALVPSRTVPLALSCAQLPSLQLYAS